MGGNQAEFRAAYEDAKAADAELDAAFAEVCAVIGHYDYIWGADATRAEYARQHGLIDDERDTLIATYENEGQRAAYNIIGIDGGPQPWMTDRASMELLWPVKKYQRAAAQRRAIAKRLRKAIAAATKVAA